MNQIDKFKILKDFSKSNDKPNKTIQQFVYELIEENKLLKRNCNIGYENLNFYRGECERLKRKINKVIEVIEEILIFNDDNGTTVAIGNVKEELQFYLSDCETLDEFRKLCKNNSWEE